MCVQHFSKLGNKVQSLPSLSQPAHVAPGPMAQGSRACRTSGSGQGGVGSNASPKMPTAPTRPLLHHAQQSPIARGWRVGGGGFLQLGVCGRITCEVGGWAGDMFSFRMGVGCGLRNQCFHIAKKILASGAYVRTRQRAQYGPRGHGVPSEPFFSRAGLLAGPLQPPYTLIRALI